jgi:hypothetical protein
MTANHPPKEMIRVYLAERRAHPRPPESPEDIRQQLGWRILEAERKINARSAK